MRSSRVPAVLLLLLAGTAAGQAAPAVGASPTPAATVEAVQVEALVQSARELAADLAELRSLPRDEQHAGRVIEARDRAARSLESLLAAAGLSREELVRLIDAGNVQTGTDENGEPVCRPLGEPRR